MDNQLLALMITAAGLGFVHTLLGPDHYIPFIALAKAGKWTIKKTSVITGICGLGHIASSFFIGILVIKLSHSFTGLQTFESFRNNVAGWLLISFGMVYMIWGIKKIFREKNKNRITEVLQNDSSKRDTNRSGNHDLLAWTLFVIFIFGPCEPLIPLIMFPSANINLMALIMVAAVFGLTTILTMLIVVILTVYGINKITTPFTGIYNNALAGMLILICGIGMQFLGL